MKLEKRYIAIAVSLLLLTVINLNLASAIADDIHLNIQTTNSTGGVLTGTFTFEFNITTDAACNTVKYSNYTSQTTDTRGIISYYLNNVSLNFTEQYWLCYYRDGALQSSSKLAWRKINRTS